MPSDPKTLMDVLGDDDDRDPAALVGEALTGLLNGELPGVPDEDLERRIIELLKQALEMECVLDARVAAEERRSS